MRENGREGRGGELARVLLIDTCGAEASLAVAEGGAVRAAVRMPGRRASEQLLVGVQELLEEQGWRVRELDGIAAVRGPGSFTGVRVGLSAAKGLAEGGGVPLFAVSRLEVLRVKAGRPGAGCLVVLQAGRGEFFWEISSENGADEQRGVAGAERLLRRAREQRLAVVCEMTGAEELRAVAGGETGELVVVDGLMAADALPVMLREMRDGRLADALLLDAWYLHKTEEDTLARQRLHRERKAGGEVAGGEQR